MLKILLTMVFSILMVGAHAETLSKPLPVNQAFSLSARIDENNQLILQWNIAKDYYLYRDQLQIEPTPINQIRIGQFNLPLGQQKDDKARGSYQVYANKLQVILPLLPPLTGTLDVKIHYQGCSSQGFCYPPQQKALLVNLGTLQGPKDLTTMLYNADTKPPVVKETNFIASLFSQHHLFFMLATFLGLGLLLAFTPCVLPMIPILSSIIIDQEQHRGFRLSLAYVSGMAIAYAGAGVLTAVLGNSVQAALQTPLVIGIFGGLFLLLALSLFGCFDLKLPRSWHNQVARWSEKHEGGTYLGVFFMGGLSILIVSPCISAPLVGVLAYIAKTGDALLGGTALLFLGIGMGIPLLLLGLSAERFLPRTGPWMEKLKKVFGVLMVGMAVWIMVPLFMHQPVASSFVVVKNMQQLDDALETAKRNKKEVILDFYADWCKSCVVMDHYVFNHPEVKTALNSFVRLRADVTEHSSFDQALQKRFKVVAPPTILFFDPHGQELTAEQVVGEINAKELLAEIAQIKSQLCKKDTYYC